MTSKPTLARALSLPLTVLFGLGVTIGAGIYVLIGATAGRAGMHAPLAFLLAGVVMAPTAMAYAELASRMLVSAGEAAYVDAGFNSGLLARVVGLIVLAVGIISAAAIAKGSVGYIRELITLPANVILIGVIVIMGIVAAWGILESVTIAAVMTLIEIGGLLAIIVVGVTNSPGLVARLPEVWTGLGGLATTTGVLSASLLAFFAFIGFQGLANIAEEIQEPQTNLPKAIFLTLAISTVFYMIVVWIALVAVPRSELAVAGAPLSLVFERVTGAPPIVISAIAVVATINGVIVQMVMASRVAYGMAQRNLLPQGLARVSSVTQTPLRATALVVLVVLALALALPLERLAEITSQLTLIVFALVNGALVLLKWRGGPPTEGGYTTSIAVPIVGCVLCVALLVATQFVE